MLFSEMLVDALYEEIDIKLDFDEYVEGVFDYKVGDRDKTTVPIMNNEIAVQLFASNVIDATGAIGDISKD